MGTQPETTGRPRVGRRPRAEGGPRPLPRRPSPAVAQRRRIAVIAAAAAIALGAALWLWDGNPAARSPEEVPGSAAWAARHYGDPDKPGFRRRNIVEIEFLGRSMFVHRKASRHFLRLERLFEARAPEYAATVALGELDDWSYENRTVRGGENKSNHAFGLAIDVNALANPLGTAGDMPEEVVEQWKAEGGEWGGDWSRPDPMHFESHLEPGQIRDRYRSDGTPRPWYLEELVSG
jgi:hypothetical protein